MTQPMTPTHPLTSTTTGAAASADWRGFAAAIRESLLAEQPAWATISGVISTHPPYTAPTDTPLAAVPHASTAPKSSTPTMGASTPTRPADTANAAPRTDLDDILDFVEAEAEAAAALMADALPPVPDGTGQGGYGLYPAACRGACRNPAGRHLRQPCRAVYCPERARVADGAFRRTRPAWTRPSTRSLTIP